MPFKKKIEPAPDLLYVLGTGSLWQNNEIRFSLRSVEKYLPHARIFVIGHRPKWIKNVIHIPAEDPHPHKLRNVIAKIKKACMDPRLGERFAVMNDDFFMLKPIEDIKTYHRGTIIGTMRRHPTRRGYYYEALAATRRFLLDQDLGGEPLDYGVHAPMIFEKKRARALASLTDVAEGLLFRTVYANLRGMGGYFRNDVKITDLKDLKTRKFKSVDMISSSDGVALNRRFREWLMKKFPDPCRYEASQEDDDMKRARRYHVTKRFNWQDRSYSPGEIVEDRIPPKIVREHGLKPLEEEAVDESGGE